MGWAAEGRIGSAGGYSTPLPASHSSNAVREVGRGDATTAEEWTRRMPSTLNLGCLALQAKKFAQGPGGMTPNSSKCREITRLVMSQT